MSINHFSSLDLPETTLWWTHQNPQQQNIQIMEPIPNPSWPLHHHKNLFNLNNNNNEEDEEFEEQVQQNEQATSSQEQDEEQQQQEEEREPMFEKPLTPSDVGKLNRLVIPKQHAEKYFPLGAASASPSLASAVTSTTASDSGECKGLLLSFEDESGKCWRFRYSYWNSSQSYVLTKGWSRYVKDKRLDAGDIVSFERHRGDSQRLFIRWRRRSGDSAATAAQVSRAGHSGGGGGGDGSNNGKSGGGAGGVGWTSGFYCAQPSYPTHHHQQQHQLAYQQQYEDLHAGKGSQVLNQRTRPILGKCSSSNSKVLRLFGVNMECQPQQDDECSYNNVVMPSTHAADNNNNNNTNHQNLYHISNQPPHSYSNSHILHQKPYYY